MPEKGPVTNLIYLRHRCHVVSDANGPVGILMDIIALARRESIVLTAASIAYFAFISLIPLLMFLVVAVSIFGSEALAARAVSRAARTLTPENANLLREIAVDTTNEQGVTAVGGALLLWGALLIFRALNTAFAGIYSTHGEHSLYDAIRDVVLVFAIVVLTAVAIVGAGVALSVFVRTQLWKTLGPLILFAVLSVVFLPLYYILPDVKVRVVEALPGTVFAAAGWTILQTVFGYYMAISGATRFYGAASAFLIVLLWLYAGGFVLLLGAILNAVLAGYSDPDSAWTFSYES